jgi:hypothetical protein
MVNSVCVFSLFDFRRSSSLPVAALTEAQFKEIKTMPVWSDLYCFGKMEYLINLGLMCIIFIAIDFSFFLVQSEVIRKETI